MLYTTKCLCKDEFEVPSEHDLSFDMKDVKRVMSTKDNIGCFIYYYGEEDVCDHIADSYDYFSNKWRLYKQTVAYNNLMQFRN